MAGVRLGPYHRVLEVQQEFSSLFACIWAGGFGLSHEEVKRAAGLFYSFVFAIASAPCGFLYLITNT